MYQSSRLYLTCELYTFPKPTRNSLLTLQSSDSNPEVIEKDMLDSFRVRLLPSKHPRITPLHPSFPALNPQRLREEGSQHLYRYGRFGRDQRNRRRGRRALLCKQSCSERRRREVQRCVQERGNFVLVD